MLFYDSDIFGYDFFAFSALDEQFYFVFRSGNREFDVLDFVAVDFPADSCAVRNITGLEQNDVTLFVH